MTISHLSRNINHGYEMTWHITTEIKLANTCSMEISAGKGSFNNYGKLHFRAFYDWLKFQGGSNTFALLFKPKM